MATKTKWYCCTKCAEVDSYEVYDDGDTSFPRGEYLVHRDYIMVADTREEAEQELIDFGVIQWLDTMVGITPAQPTADTPPAAPRMNYIKCPHCDGNGGKRYTHLGGTSGIMTGFQECKHCNGTGSIEAPATPPAAPSETTAKFAVGDAVVWPQTPAYKMVIHMRAVNNEGWIVRPDIDDEELSLYRGYAADGELSPYEGSNLQWQLEGREMYAKLQAISDGRLKTLNEKAEELRREWQRAENAESEAAALRRKLEAVVAKVIEIDFAAVEVLGEWTLVQPEFAPDWTAPYKEIVALCAAAIAATKGASDV